jgi:hypothetical protein
MQSINDLGCTFRAVKHYPCAAHAEMNTTTFLQDPGAYLSVGPLLAFESD